MEAHEHTLWPLLALHLPYVNIIAVERYVCRDSIVVVFTAENRWRWTVMTPFN